VLAAVLPAVLGSSHTLWNYKRIQEKVREDNDAEPGTNESESTSVTCCENLAPERRNVIVTFM